jgi:UDP-N-acetyl-D-mannosaminuronate dehydrogenase
MNLKNKPIAIIGLGYVGLPLAVEFCKHRDTLGFDINPARIAELQSGKDHTLECSPEELQAAMHLRYSANLPVQYGAIVLSDVKSILPLGVADGCFQITQQVRF